MMKVMSGDAGRCHVMQRNGTKCYYFVMRCGCLLGLTELCEVMDGKLMSCGLRQNMSPQYASEFQTIALYRKILRRTTPHHKVPLGSNYYKIFFFSQHKGFMNVANVNPDGIVEWLGDDGVVNSDVKETMAEFVEMLE